MLGATDTGPKQLDSVEEASETLQGLLDGLRGRLAGDEAAGLGAVAAMLDKMKSQGDGTEQLMLKKQQEQVLWPLSAWGEGPWHPRLVALGGMI